MLVFPSSWHTWWMTWFVPGSSLASGQCLTYLRCHLCVICRERAQSWWRTSGLSLRPVYRNSRPHRISCEVFSPPLLPAATEGFAVCVSGHVSKSLKPPSWIVQEEASSGQHPREALCSPAAFPCLTRISGHAGTSRQVRREWGSRWPWAARPQAPALLASAPASPPHSLRVYRHWHLGLPKVVVGGVLPAESRPPVLLGLHTRLFHVFSSQVHIICWDPDGVTLTSANSSYSQMVRNPTIIFTDLLYVSNITKPYN